MIKIKGIALLAVLAIGLLAIPACGNTNKARNEQQTATSTEPPPAPDNTARNAAEPGGTAGPPFEQGTSDSDMQTTQKVRQGLMDDTTLSQTAKNVKVITNEGKVLLLGPVTNEQERSRIESIAEGVVGAGNVRSEMEVTHS